MDEFLLKLSLQTAVPLHILDLQRLAPDTWPGVAQRWAFDAASVVASRGDQLMFRTKPHKGEGGTADTFNHLARGLAALACNPGGVDFLGLHFEATDLPKPPTARPVITIELPEGPLCE